MLTPRSALGSFTGSRIVSISLVVFSQVLRNTLAKCQQHDLWFGSCVFLAKPKPTSITSWGNPMAKIVYIRYKRIWGASEPNDFLTSLQLFRIVWVMLYEWKSIWRNHVSLGLRKTFLKSQGTTGMSVNLQKSRLSFFPDLEAKMQVSSWPVPLSLEGHQTAKEGCTG